MLLLWFIYGVAGMYLFGTLDLSVTQILDKNQNFSTFYNAVCLLFQCITGENWDLIMRDCMGNYGCVGGIDECGNPVIAVFYWVSYTILGQYIFLNMFLAVILENFTEENDLIESGITEKDLENYQKAWCKFAPYAEEKIPVKCLPGLLNSLETPLGFKGQQLRPAQILSIVHALQIKVYNGNVFFVDLLYTLALAISGVDMDKANRCEAVENLRKIFKRTLKASTRSKYISQAVDQEYASRALAGLIILNAWRNYLINKKIKYARK